MVRDSRADVSRAGEGSAPEGSAPESGAPESSAPESGARAQGGAGGARDDFERFFASEQAGAQRLAARLGPSAAAEDVTAEAFTRLYRHWEAVDDPLRYLRRSVRSLVVDELRRSDVARRHLHRVADPEVAVVRPLEDAVADSQQLTAALLQLAPRQREAVVLRYALDLSEADVARSMGVTPGTVKSSASRALTSLRALVA